MSVESDPKELHLMAIALVQDGIGMLSKDMEVQLARFEKDGMQWREYVIEKVNGYRLPPEFVLLAIRKRWQEHGDGDVEAFTREVLASWGVI